MRRARPHARGGGTAGALPADDFGPSEVSITPRKRPSPQPLGSASGGRAPRDLRRRRHVFWLCAVCRAGVRSAVMGWAGDSPSRLLLLQSV